jgi:hypothetical protein
MTAGSGQASVSSPPSTSRVTCQQQWHRLWLYLHAACKHGSSDTIRHDGWHAINITMLLHLPASRTAALRCCTCLCEPASCQAANRIKVPTMCRHTHHTPLHADMTHSPPFHCPDVWLDALFVSTDPSLLTQLLLTLTLPAALSNSTLEANVACGHFSSAANIWPCKYRGRGAVRAAEWCSGHTKYVPTQC